MVLAAVTAVVLILGVGLAYVGTTRPGPEQPPPLVPSGDRRDEPTGVGAEQRQSEVKAGDRAPDLNLVIPLINDNFSGPDNNHFEIGLGWKDQEDFRLENRLYIIRSSATPKDWDRMNRRVSSNHCRQDAKGDFACQLVGRVTTGGDHGWALGLNSDSDFNLGVRLRRDGLVEVGNFRWAKETPSTMGPPIRPPAFKSGDEFNKLLVVCRGGRKLEIYVNDSAIGPPIRLDSPIPPVYPRITLWKRGPAANEAGRAEFKQFTLWQLPPSAPSVP
jgi:hypothetical protein